MIAKGIGRQLVILVLGSVDTIFGFFFGFLKVMLFVFVFFQLKYWFIIIINGH